VASRASSLSKSSATNESVGLELGLGVLDALEVEARTAVLVDSGLAGDGSEIGGGAGGGEGAMVVEVKRTMLCKPTKLSNRRLALISALDPPRPLGQPIASNAICWSTFCCATSTGVVM
jgi:hypothetical protein